MTSNINHYLISYTALASSPDTLQFLAETPNNTTSTVITGLKANTVYSFKIKAFTDQGYGEYSKTSEVTTEEEAGTVLLEQKYGMNQRACYGSSCSYYC